MKSAEIAFPRPDTAVAPLVGAWIEIGELPLLEKGKSPSLPLWERGLKLPYEPYTGGKPCRSPCGSVD